MGTYLDSASAYTLYRSETEAPYFVDKTMLLAELFPLVRSGNRHICITRPRRFGKTVAANMVSAFFGKGADSRELFSSLQVAQVPGFLENLNQYHVVHIDFSLTDDICMDYAQYIGAVKTLLKEDLSDAYPQVDFRENSPVYEDFLRVFNKTGDRFLFVLDEWDAVFHMSFMTEQDKRSYLLFLKGLLKDKPYVSLTYMTGILPIAKYSSGSELNMFYEYKMSSEEKYSEYFGFLDCEVDRLFDKYRNLCTGRQRVTREGLRLWYDGYQTKSGTRVYNPRSVVLALANNNLTGYWTSSGPYDEIFHYIRQNTDGVKKDLSLMIAGESVEADIHEYAANAMELRTRDEIFSAMVVYGFLSCREGKVSIPNRELMDQFSEMIRNRTELGYINRLAAESGKMLAATLRGDTKTVDEVLAFAHDTEVPLFSYNSEAELSAIVNLSYLSARDAYRVEREDKAGIGYVDFIFYPYKKDADCIILELKVDSTPKQAIRQIRERKYDLRFYGKPGEELCFTGRILAVGISYFRDTKRHQCEIEVLREAL